MTRMTPAGTHRRQFLQAGAGVAAGWALAPATSLALSLIHI
mgnify:CR=1 FL=1